MERSLGRAFAVPRTTAATIATWVVSEMAELAERMAEVCALHLSARCWMDYKFVIAR